MGFHFTVFVSISYQDSFKLVMIIPGVIPRTLHKHKYITLLLNNFLESTNDVSTWLFNKQASNNK